MEIINKKELAEFLGCKETTINHYVFTRQIPFFKMGKETKFIRGNIEKWLIAREQNSTFNLTEGI